MSTEAIVHVVDDDLAVRQSLGFLLASAGFAVRLHDSATAFLKTVTDLDDACIVSDVRMPGLDGIAFLQRLAELRVVVPVIIMTGHADVPLAVEAMKQGAVDFIEKPFDDEVFLASVRAALARAGGRTEGDESQRETLSRLATLSERERQVLDGLIAGKSNKAIAQELGISPRTVEIYRANVMTKTGAGSLSELVRMVVLATS